MKLSVVITTLNRADLVKDCIESLKQNTLVTHEVVLVDDGSDQANKALFEQLQNYGYVDTLVTNERNRGSAFSMNAGVKAVTGDYIAIVNNDILFAPNWAPPLMQALSDDVWISGPLITEGALPAEFPNVALEKRMMNFLPVQGCCLMVKPDLFEKIGYFPEELTLWYNDNWLGDSVAAKGKKVVVVEDSYVHHFRSQTANKQVIPNMDEIVKQNEEAYFSKYKPT